jgi:GTP-binding protein YchF
MQLGIVGLPRAGKSTLFGAVTKSGSETAKKGDLRIGAISVPDPRVDFLSAMYKPKKTIYAQLQVVLPHRPEGGDKAKKGDTGLLPVRGADALVHVVRNFASPGEDPPGPARDITEFDQELILSDLIVVEKRLERLEADLKKGKKEAAQELDLMRRVKETLDQERPLREAPELAQDPLLRGYTLLSGKPMLIVFNNADEDPDMPDPGAAPKDACLVVRAKLEQELAQMSGEEAAAFLGEFGIAETAMDRMIRAAYALLGRISFFTVGGDEVRAWTVRRGALAPDAAEAIHTDMRRGFIRAEVLAYQDLVDAGTFVEARKRGTVRLEGKGYEVKDGDILTIRFNV